MPICKGSERVLSNDVVKIPLAQKDSFYAVALVFCKNCGGVRLFELTEMGISLDIEQEPGDEW